MSQIKDIEQLIARYLNGECNVSERNELLSWIDTSEANKKLFYRIKDVWDASLKKEDRAHQALFHFYKQQATKNNQSQKVIQLWKRVASVAAVFVVGLVSIVLLNTQLGTDNSMVTFKVPLGSRSEVMLADGSQVVLNSGSEITYPATFNSKQREVTLSGEAFFKVKSDKNHPFIVKTSDFNVHVSGTQFNVCSYTDNNYSSLTLAEGKVGIQFSGKDELVDVSPGEKLNINRENRKYHISETEVETAFAWKDGEFCFKETAFPELIKRLERWYDVTLTYSAPELEEMEYSGRFKNQESIWQVLDALKLTSPINYKKQGFREFKIIYQPM
ncbi:MAG: FecR domain-containing protein [Bacteroidetes bacterium]|nr:FecR domain-containing protein [Bacteroidota bacterium]